MVKIHQLPFVMFFAAEGIQVLCENSTLKYGVTEIGSINKVMIDAF